MLENKVLRRMFERMWEETTAGSTKLHINEFQVVQPLSNDISVTGTKEYAMNMTYRTHGWGEKCIHNFR
jgi:hypothetical protein